MPIECKKNVPKPTKAQMLSKRLGLCAANADDMDNRKIACCLASGFGVAILLQWNVTTYIPFLNLLLVCCLFSAWFFYVLQDLTQYLNHRLMMDIIYIIIRLWAPDIIVGFLKSTWEWMLGGASSHGICSDTLKLVSSTAFIFRCMIVPFCLILPVCRAFTKSRCTK